MIRGSEASSRWWGSVLCIMAGNQGKCRLCMCKVMWVLGILGLGVFAGLKFLHSGVLRVTGRRWCSMVEMIRVMSYMA